MLTYFIYPTFMSLNNVYLFHENDLNYNIIYLHPWRRWPGRGMATLNL